MPRPHASARLGRLLAWGLAATGFLAAGGPRPADACEPLPWVAEILIPPPEQIPLPLDGAFLAVVSAPDGSEGNLSLARADGTMIPITAMLEGTTSNEQAIVRAFATVELQPNTEHVWTIGSELRPFMTGDTIDPAFPVLGELSTTYVGSGVEAGCFGEEIPFDDYEVQITSVSEPVGTVAVAPPDAPGRVVVGMGDTLWLRVYADEDLCFAVTAEDYGGHIVDAGTVCLQGPTVAGGSSSGDAGTDETGAPGSGSGSTGDDGPIATSTGAMMDATTGTTDAPASDDGPSKGCACQASSGSREGLGLAVVVLGLLLRRRRARPGSRPRNR